MASLNKTSVRDEVSRLKADFETLRSAGKVSAESLALMNSLFMIIELILSIFLERATKKDSKNSSKPASQMDKEDTSSSQPGCHRKARAQNSGVAGNRRVKETVRTAKVAVCEVCGEALTETASIGHERRTKIDLVFEKVVEHVEAEIKQCPACGSTNKGRFPADMPGPLQYGSGLKAFVINLLVGQMVALNRIQGLVKSLIGELLSEASLLNFVLRLHTALESWETRMIEQLIQSPSLHVDETSFRVDKRNHWIHVYASGDVTLKFLHRKRGSEAIKSIGIIPRYGGVIIHDCWTSYLSYHHCDHGLCGAHLLRELTFIIESNHYAWAKNMKRLLQETCKTVSKRKRKRLTQKEYTRLQRRYRNILTRGEKELPEIPPKPSGKRGKLAKSDAHNLHERMRVHEASVLLFAKREQVSFTNNRAERDLRMSKVKQKVSGCFRTEKYAHAYCRISSYLQTMANKGYNPLVAIQMALAGNVGE